MIEGIDIDRTQDQYLYALLLTTRLAEKYKLILYPDSDGTLEDLYLNYSDYRQVCEEVYSRLQFLEEIHLSSERKEAETMQAICELAFSFLQRSPSHYEGLSGKSYFDFEGELDSVPDFQIFYEDSLKLVVTELERKVLWNDAILHNNQVGYNVPLPHL